MIDARDGAGRLVSRSLVAYGQVSLNAAASHLAFCEVWRNTDLEWGYRVCAYDVGRRAVGVVLESKGVQVIAWAWLANDRLAVTSSTDQGIRLDVRSTDGKSIVVQERLRVAALAPERRHVVMSLDGKTFMRIEGGTLVAKAMATAPVALQALGWLPGSSLLVLYAQHAVPPNRDVPGLAGRVRVKTIYTLDANGGVLREVLTVSDEADLVMGGWGGDPIELSQGGKLIVTGLSRRQVVKIDESLVVLELGQRPRKSRSSDGWGWDLRPLVVRSIEKAAAEATQERARMLLKSRGKVVSAWLLALEQEARPVRNEVLRLLAVGARTEGPMQSGPSGRLLDLYFNDPTAVPDELLDLFVSTKLHQGRGGFPSIYATGPRALPSLFALLSDQRTPYLVRRMVPYVALQMMDNPRYRTKEANRKVMRTFLASLEQQAHEKERFWYAGLRFGYFGDLRSVDVVQAALDRADPIESQFAFGTLVRPLQRVLRWDLARLSREMNSLPAYRARVGELSKWMNANRDRLAYDPVEGAYRLK